jgi:hypothetical protein
MKNINKIYLLFLLVFSAASCDRVFENDVKTVTSPELHVIVKDTNDEKVGGVTVDLYNNLEDFDNKTNSIATKTTDTEGKSIFTASELAEPGIFYVHAEKNGVTNSASNTATPYLLLNDGHTFFFTVIE